MARRYVVIGNGIAGQTAAEELRKADAEASIVMIAAERHPLYNRVALPRYLRGQVRREKVLMRTVEDYTNRNLEIHFETWATEIDVNSKVVRTNRGQEFPYDALLIATGGRPKPPPWPGSDEVSSCLGFQTLDDTDAIIEKADASERVLVMGGSFIGYELAEGVSYRKKAKLTWIMRGPWFLRYVLDEEGGKLCRQMGEAQDVEFIVEDEVKKFSRTNGRFHAETVNGKHVDFDLLTYGVGLDYYTEPVRDTGIPKRRMFMQLATSRCFTTSWSSATTRWARGTTRKRTARWRRATWPARMRIFSTSPPTRRRCSDRRWR